MPIATDTDQPDLVELWSTAGGRDQLEAAAWARRLLDFPAGEAMIAVAEDHDSGHLAGRLAFAPGDVSIDGVAVTPIRPLGAILRPDVTASLLSNCDLLSADADRSLDVTLGAGINEANEQALKRAPANPIAKVAILKTSLFDRPLRDLGFTRDAYDFPVILMRLDERIREEDVALDRWYLSAND